MPKSKNPRKSAAPADRTPSEPARREPAPGPGGTPHLPTEEAFELLTRFSRETGETVTEFLRRFGEEQQKNYEAWLASLTDATRPTSRDREVSEAQARIEEWNRRAEEIGQRVREAFQTSLVPQSDLFEQWVKPFLPKEATADERTREAQELVQKMWTGLTTNVSRRLFDALQPGKSVKDLVIVQEDSLKEFTESFQKLTQLYFTSPSFVALFGKTLDASLDLQKSLQGEGDVLSRLTGIPSRKELADLNQAVRELTEKVSRLDSRRA